MAQPATAAESRKVRLKRRALQLVLAARPALVWALLGLGVAAFLLLPLAAKNISADEKAILFGGREPAARTSEWLAFALTQAAQLAAAGPWPDVPSLLAAAVAALPASAAAHAPTIHADPAAVPPLSIHAGCAGAAHIIARTPRGDGLEGLALVLPADPSRPQQAALAAAVGVAAQQHLGAMPWLAKNVVVVLVDFRCGSVPATQAWLNAYYRTTDPDADSDAGLLQQALGLELEPELDDPPTPPRISLHGWGGQLPNLDLYYIVKRNWDLHIGTPAAELGGQPQWAGAAEWLGGVLAALVGGDADAGGRLRPAAGAARRYAAELLQMAAFAAQQAAGAPTGPHAPFLLGMIDAAALALRCGEPGSGAANATLGDVLGFVEATLRTLSNLEERLHHATPMFVLAGPKRVVALGAYLAPPGLLLGSLLIQLWVELDAAPPASHPAWRKGWAAAAAVQGAGLLVAATAAAALTSLQAGRLELPWSLGAVALAAGGALSLWRWAAELQAALAEGAPTAAAAAKLLEGSGQPAGAEAEQAVDRAQQGQRKVAAGSSGGPSGGSPTTPPSTPPPARAGEGELGGDGTSSSRGDWLHCTRVTALAALALTALWLLLGQWSLCYAMLLAGLPPLLATWRGTKAQAQGASRAATLLRIGVASMPALLLGWGAHGAFSSSRLAAGDLGLLLAGAQCLAALLSAYLSAAFL